MLALLACGRLAPADAMAAASAAPALISKMHAFGPRVRHHEFQSEVLQEKKRFAVVLPAAYDPAKPNWPVLFLLHGLGRNEQTLLQDQTARTALLKAPFVIVLPQGSDSWYVNSPVTRKQYQTYIEEVFDLAQAHYHLSQERRQRGIAGWSMGGFGAMRLAEAHADQFAAVATIIGLLDFPKPDLAFKVPVKVVGEDPAYWATINPLNHADKLRGLSVLLITGDKAGDKPLNETFRQRLQALHIPHDYRELPGGHSFGVIQQALPIVLEFMASKICP
jgi:S-formylglutathione hydrolase FrmB